MKRRTLETRSLKEETIKKLLSFTLKQSVSNMIRLSSIDMHPNEAIYSNRAASYIQMKEFKKA